MKIKPNRKSLTHIPLFKKGFMPPRVVKCVSVCMRPHLYAIDLLTYSYLNVHYFKWFHFRKMAATNRTSSKRLIIISGTSRSLQVLEGRETAIWYKFRCSKTRIVTMMWICEDVRNRMDILNSERSYLSSISPLKWALLHIQLKEKKCNKHFRFGKNL